MATRDSTQWSSASQSPKSGYGFLGAILDSLDDQPLLDVLEDYRRTGRPGYPVKAMWRTHLVKFLLKIRYTNELLERLPRSRKLRAVCGFGEEVPSESAMSRFVNRLVDHQGLVEECLVNATEEIRGLVPAVKQRKGRQDQPLPPLGAVLAVDSTLFETYSNPNRKVVSDPDARWGCETQCQDQRGQAGWGFGYKMPLISDATHGVPLAFRITPANENDSTELPAALSKTLAAYPWLEPGCLLADRGYDSLPITGYSLGWALFLLFTYGSLRQRMGCTTASILRRANRPALASSR